MALQAPAKIRSSRSAGRNGRQHGLPAWSLSATFPPRELPPSPPPGYSPRFPITTPDASDPCRLCSQRFPHQQPPSESHQRPRSQPPQHLRHLRKPLRHRSASLRTTPQAHPSPQGTNWFPCIPRLPCSRPLHPIPCGIPPMRHMLDPIRSSSPAQQAPWRSCRIPRKLLPMPSTLPAQRLRKALCPCFPSPRPFAPCSNPLASPLGIPPIPPCLLLDGPHM